MVQEHRDDPLLQGLLRHELNLILKHSLELLVGGPGPVVRVDEPPESGREFTGGQGVPGPLGPDREPRVFRLPLGDEGLEGRHPLLRPVLGGDRHGVVRGLGAVPAPRLRADVPRQAGEAPLPPGPGKDLATASSAVPAEHGLSTVEAARSVLPL